MKPPSRAYASSLARRVTKHLSYIPKPCTLNTCKGALTVAILSKLQGGLQKINVSTELSPTSLSLNPSTPEPSTPKRRNLKP